MIRGITCGPKLPTPGPTARCSANSAIACRVSAGRPERTGFSSASTAAAPAPAGSPRRTGTGKVPSGATLPASGSSPRSPRRSPWPPGPQQAGRALERAVPPCHGGCRASRARKHRASPRLRRPSTPGPSSTPSSFDRWRQQAVLRRAARAAGLDVAKLTLHMLHATAATAATLLRAAGVAVEDVQELLGHASSVTTQRYDRGQSALDGHAAYRLTDLLTAQPPNRPRRRHKALRRDPAEVTATSEEEDATVHARRPRPRRHRGTQPLAGNAARPPTPRGDNRQPPPTPTRRTHYPRSTRQPRNRLVTFCNSGRGYDQIGPRRRDTSAPSAPDSRRPTLPTRPTSSSSTVHPDGEGIGRHRSHLPDQSGPARPLPLRRRPDPHRRTTSHGGPTTWSNSQRESNSFAASTGG
ncbi:tyrosine-type recombinase/integrase [Nonomuraea ceibae]|uniref:tyrosine-type recombinase/integrase n=1 Tax=Nonomuraea ceibae TaxID=1935170 RepID=UPI003558FA99